MVAVSWAVLAANGVFLYSVPMSGRKKAQREAEWVRRSVADAVAYLTADQEAVDKVVQRADDYELRWGVVQIARRAIAVLAERDGTTPDVTASSLGGDVIASAVG